MTEQSGWEYWESSSCEIPTAVAKATVSYTGTTYNSLATYTCNYGYNFTGTSRDAVCDNTGKWTGFSGQCTFPQDCSDILAADSSAPDGIYTIRPTVDTGTIDVYCDMTNNGGGWTVFQRRMDGSENFDRYWADYRDGFGSLTQEFWLGNSAIYRITNQQAYTLRVDMADFSNNNAYAVYSQFSIDDESQSFRLNVNGYSGNAGDSLISYHDSMYFTTRDNDNDATGDETNCAVIMPGGWWHRDCLTSNLNGQYGNTGYSTGVNWESWKGYYYSLKATTMKIRPQ